MGINHIQKLYLKHQILIKGYVIMEGSKIDGWLHQKGLDPVHSIWKHIMQYA